MLEPSAPSTTVNSSVVPSSKVSVTTPVSSSRETLRMPLPSSSVGAPQLNCDPPRTRTPMLTQMRPAPAGTLDTRSYQPAGMPFELAGSAGFDAARL